MRVRFFWVLLLTLVGLLLAYGAGIYKFNEVLLYAWVDQWLAEIASDVLTMAHQQEGQPPPPTPEAFPAVPRLYWQVWFVWTDDTRLLRRSANAPTIALDPEARSRPGSAPVRRTVRWQDRFWRVYTLSHKIQPTSSMSARYWVAQVALDITPWRDRQAWLTVGMFAGGALVVGVMALALNRMLRWTFWPMEQVARLADEIMTTEDLSRRLPVVGLTVPELHTWAQAFNAALDRLEELFQQQRRFLADVSHELRTPLTVIRGQAQLMRRTGAYDPEAVADIEREAERLARLVEDLLFLARAEAGTLPLRREKVDLDIIVLDVLRQAQVLGQAKQQQVVLEHLEPLPVVGDPDRLTQALLNLVSNAVRYTPEGGTIRLGARREGEWAVVWVSDTGPGIPPEDLPHVFERFYRAQRSRTRRGPGGFGLGLAIVQWIVDAHGGWVTVQSRVGQGSTFTLHLPLDLERAGLLFDDAEDA